MQLNLKNPLMFFDLETTGINVSKDRIIEISYLKVFPNGKEESKTMRVNPEMPIPAASTAIVTDRRATSRQSPLMNIGASAWRERPSR